MSAGTSNTTSPVLLLLSAHPLPTSAPGLGALPQPGAQGRPLPPPRPRRAWHRWSWEDGPDVSQPPCPPAAPSHGGTPSSEDLGLTRVWSPALSLNRCHPPCGPAGGAGLAGCPARVCLAGLSVPPTLARSKAGPPDDLTDRLPHSSYSAAPALLPGLPSRLPSPAGLLLQEAFLDWEGIAQHGAVPAWPPGGWWECRCSGSHSTRPQGSTHMLQLETP